MLKWLDESSFEIGGYKITLDYAHGGSQRHSSNLDFTIMKSRDFLPHYTSLRDGGYKKILELGVYQGGSFVFLDQLLQPDKLSAIELSKDRIQALDNYTKTSSEKLHVYYGVSQDDGRALNSIIENDFGGTLDLVVDDASHFYEPTKEAFMVAFPKLRPGGLYIIEDWSWSFQDIFQDPKNAWFRRNALVNLVVDFMESMAILPTIEDVEISRQMLKIRRSSAPANAVFPIRARRGRSVGLL